MRSSRGMGAVNPSKMPAGKRMQRRDNTDFTQYAGGGAVKKKAADCGCSTPRSKGSKK